MKVCFSCLIDNTVKLRFQSMNFIASIRELYPDIQQDIVFHIIGDHPQEYLDYCKRAGVHLVPVKPFGTEPNAKYCNKLQQLTSPFFQNYDLAILCDADFVFVEKIDELLTVEKIQAKAAGIALPDVNTLLGLFDTLGMPQPQDSNISAYTLENIPPYYCNGGLYVVPVQYLEQLAPSWEKHARWCLHELSEKVSHYSDQVAFMLALHELQLPFQYLEDAWNFSIHLRHSFYTGKNILTPKGIHYHSALQSDGSLIPLGIPAIDASIKKANNAIKRYGCCNFCNSTYWDFWYTFYNDIASDSQDEDLNLKRKHIYPLLSYFRNQSVLDVGSGDGKIMCESDALDYTGIDISKVAIESASLKRPDWKFLCTSCFQIEQRYDVVMCLDVLIHQSSQEEYLQLVDRLIGLSKDTLIISGYTKRPTLLGNTKYYYESLIDTLAQDPRIGKITSAYTHREVTLLVVEKKSNHPIHANNISLYALAQAIICTPYDNLAKDLVALSRKHFGFFTTTATRVLEYPWIIAHAGDVVGKRILDLGAGINPLPLWFTQQKAQVVTVDAHPQTVTPAQLHLANEWGFFDYTTIDKTITSYNEDVQNLALDPFDIIYCVSGIEHMTKTMRQANIKHLRNILTANGLLLLTADLIPGTRRLWNYPAGEVVEDWAHHGTIDDLLVELQDVGFAIDTVSFEVNCLGSPADIAFIKATLNA